MSGKSDDNKVLQHEIEASTQAISTFTDKQLFDLYVKLKESYRRTETIDANFNRMSAELFAEFLPGGIYAEMQESEQKKIYTVFTSFLNAQPSSTREANTARSFAPFDNLFLNFQSTYPRSSFSTRPRYVVRHYHYQQSNWFNDYLFWHWACSGNSSRNQQSSEDFLKLLLVLIVAAIAAVVLYFAACYLFTAIADSMERFWYGEGWLQASISLLGVIGGAVAGAILMMTVILPFGALAILCIASASIVAAALTAGLTNVIQDACIEAMNADALDSADPYRFALTAAESVALEQKGIDPTKVKCAIAALRVEIAELPSLSSRWFSDDASPKQAKLQTIRALRRGDLEEVDVAGLHFDLHTDAAPEVVQSSNDAFYPPNDLAELGVPVAGVPLASLPQDQREYKAAFGYSG